jgi:fatty acid hydroxylase family protein
MPEIVLPPFVVASANTIGIILVAMAVVGLIEIAIPLREQRQWGRRHLWPNLALTFITFATNIILNTALVLALAWAQSISFGLLNMVKVPPLWSIVIVVLVLDFSFYVAHVAMHKIPFFWRAHSVHHSDPALDVTTTIRQHPIESVIRYAYLAIRPSAGRGPRRLRSLSRAVGRQWTARTLQYPGSALARSHAVVGDDLAEHAQGSPLTRATADRYELREPVFDLGSDFLHIHPVEAGNRHQLRPARP